MAPVFYALIFTALLLSCKGKKKTETDPDKTFISAISIIKKDIADVDTSLYSIIKVDSRNGVSDTVAISREEFAKYAKDFTDAPDIASEDLQDEYTETSAFDTLTNKVNISYITKDPELEVKNQMLNIRPIAGQESLVETIYIYQVMEEDDGIVEKKMTWEIGKWFQVVTITQKEKAPEEIRKVKVIWTAGPGN